MTLFLCMPFEFTCKVMLAKLFDTLLPLTTLQYLKHAFNITLLQNNFFIDF